MNTFRQQLLIAAAALTGLAVLYAATQLFQRPYTFRGSAIDPPLPAPQFTLQTEDGGEFQLQDQTGKIVLLFFGYTNCPDVCPATLANFKQVAAQMGERADQVAFVFITADPERDTPEQIRNYVSSFNPDFIGLSGTPEELQQVYDLYGVFVEKEAAGGATGYLVSHTSRVYVVDASGNLRLTFPFGLGASQMREDIEHLLSES